MPPSVVNHIFSYLRIIEHKLGNLAELLVKSVFINQYLDITIFELADKPACSLVRGIVHILRHSHIYERSYLLRGHYGKSTTLAPRMVLDAGSGQPSDTGAYRKTTIGPAAQQGTVYVVAGSGGWATYRTGFHPAMYHDELQTGSLVIDVEGDRLDLQFLRETGAVDDSFTILKSNAPEPLRIVRLQADTKQMTFSFRTVAGHRYHLEQSEALGSDLWESVGEPLDATSAFSQITLPASRQSGSAFFRVVEDDPQP